MSGRFSGGSISACQTHDHCQRMAGVAQWMCGRETMTPRRLRHHGPPSAATTTWGHQCAAQLLPARLPQPLREIGTARQPRPKVWAVSAAGRPRLWHALCAALTRRNHATPSTGEASEDCDALRRRPGARRHRVRRQPGTQQATQVYAGRGRCARSGAEPERVVVEEGRKDGQELCWDIGRPETGACCVTCWLQIPL